MRGIFFPANPDGVAGVGAPTIPDDHIRPFAQEINDLSFAFIAPLQTKNARIAFKE
jgi:hypothetical protein